MTFIVFLAVLMVKQSFCVVTEKDLEEQLGIDVKALREVTWKEFVNINKQIVIRYPPPEVCRLAINKDLHRNYKECCNATTNCTSEFTVCFQGACNCKSGYFTNDAQNGCEERPKKELGQICRAKDNCYTAFAICRNGQCVCRDGFVKVKQTCQPAEYDCPYKKPAKFKGILRTCIGNTDGAKTNRIVKANIKKHLPCPANYSCLVAYGPRPTILSVSGTEESYCCPPVPDIALPTKEPFGRPQKLFQDVCFYGKPSYTTDPDKGCPPGYYYFVGIGLGPACCPEPCMRHPTAQAVVLLNGKCTYVH